MASATSSARAAWVLDRGGSIPSGSRVSTGDKPLTGPATQRAPAPRALLLGTLHEQGMRRPVRERVFAGGQAQKQLSASSPLVSFVETCRAPIAETPSGALACGMSVGRLHLNDAGYKEGASWTPEADEGAGDLLRP